MQAMYYKVTLRCFVVNLLQWKAVSITYYECVFVGSLSCPALNVYAPYCHLWPTRVYESFFTLSNIRKYFRKIY